MRRPTNWVGGASVRLSKTNLVALVVTVILVGGVALSAFCVAPPTNAAAGYEAVVHDGDGNEYVLPLDKDTVQTVQSSHGSNTVEVADGRVFVRDADCDTLDCVHQGAIDSPGPQIICLPHRLWIEVVAAGAADQSTSMNVDAAASEERYDTLAR